MATGGLRQKRALNTVEVFDPKRPKVDCLEILEVACKHDSGHDQFVAVWRILCDKYS